jgi:hypothetical protein
MRVEKKQNKKIGFCWRGGGCSTMYLVWKRAIEDEKMGNRGEGC